MGSDGLVVIIAGRQRLVIQQMAKECVLIALGIHVELGPSYRKVLHGNIANLKHTSEIRKLSHQGIIHGAALAGVCRLDKGCTLKEMMAVTHAA